MQSHSEMSLGMEVVSYTGFTCFSATCCWPACNLCSNSFLLVFTGLALKLGEHEARRSQWRARAVALGLMVPRVSADGWLWVFCRAPELHVQQQLLQRLRLWGGHPAPPGYVHGHGWLHGHPLKVSARTSHAWKSVWDVWDKHGAVQISWEAKPSLSGVRAG